MTSNDFHDFPKMDRAQVPVSDKTINKIRKNGEKRRKTTKSHSDTSVDLKKHHYRKDSIKRPGGYLTFINIWGGAKSRGALNQGGALIS